MNEITARMPQPSVCAAFIERHAEEIKIGVERLGLAPEEALVFAAEVEREIAALVKAGHPAALLVRAAEAQHLAARQGFCPRRRDPLLNIEIRATAEVVVAALKALRATAVRRVWARRQAV